MGSVMAVRSKETVRCMSELSSDELREIPLPRSRHSNASATKRKGNIYFSNIFWGFDWPQTLFGELWLFLL